MVKNLPAHAREARDLGSIPGWGRSPEEGNGHPLSILPWRIPRTEEPGGLQAIGSQRVGHTWATNIPFTIVYQIQLFCCFGLSLTDPAPWLTLSAVSSWNYMPALRSLSGLWQFSPCCSAFPITGSIPEPHLLAESSPGALPLWPLVLIASISNYLPSAKCLWGAKHCFQLIMFVYSLCIVCVSTWMLRIICPLFVSQSFSLTFENGSR